MFVFSRNGSVLRSLLRQFNVAAAERGCQHILPFIGV